MLIESELILVSVAWSDLEYFYSPLDGTLSSLSQGYPLASLNSLDEEKEKLLFFDHQDVNSLCLHHHYINISYQFCVSIKLQKHNS